jgi:hypothetical protein
MESTIDECLPLAVDLVLGEGVSIGRVLMPFEDDSGD